MPSTGTGAPISTTPDWMIWLLLSISTLLAGIGFQVRRMTSR